jgi:hypothetical protein
VPNAPERTRDTNVVPIVPKVLINQSELNAAVRRAEESLAQSVVRIRYDLDSDWTGEPSIFFRIVLTDEAAKRPELNDIANAVSLILVREVRPEEHGLNSYFNFRSESEQTQLNEPTWA